MSEPMTPPPPPAADSGVSPNRTVMVVFSYLWLLALVPLLVEKDDKEVQWHAKHGLVLLVAEIVFWIGLMVITTVLGTMGMGLGCVLSLFTPFLSLAFLALHVICIVKGVGGARFLIPGVSQYADKF